MQDIASMWSVLINKQVKRKLKVMKRTFNGFILFKPETKIIMYALKDTLDHVKNSISHI